MQRVLKGYNFSVNINGVFVGFLLIALGIIMPSFITVYDFHVFDNLLASIREGDSSLMILAAFNLVMLNSIRGLPHYLGTLTLCESIIVHRNNRKINFAAVFISITIIPAVYSIIDNIYGIKYDLGIPALLVISALILISTMDLRKVSIFKKSLMIILPLMAVQWLDIAPWLSEFAFGRGEISQEIKFIAKFLNSEQFLSMCVSLFFSIFFVGFILVYKLVSDEEKLRRANEINMHNEKMLAEKTLKIVEDRTYKEIQNVVHDLKTPLTSVQALVGVLKMINFSDDRQIAYLNKIEGSVDRLSKMISEILYENEKSFVPIGELMSAIAAQISNLQYVIYVEFIIVDPDMIVCTNKIRFYRAIINVIENSFYAIDKNSGEIVIKVEKRLIDDKYKAVITISDNGVGMDEITLKSVWEDSYSSRNATGFGLSFVRSVIENHKGTIAITSTKDVGTTTEILMPIFEWRDNDGKN